MTDKAQPLPEPTREAPPRAAPAPAQRPPAPPVDTSPVAAIEEHQKATSTPDYLHAAALRAERWGGGREITRNAYIKAIDNVCNRPAGGSP